MLTEENGDLIGLMCMHVDDLFLAGDTNNKKFTGSIEALVKDITLKIKWQEFTYCGKQVQQDKDHNI